MEWFRWQQNPWGQNILRGMDWDVTWLAVLAAGLFMAAHIGLYLWRWRRLAEPVAAPNDGVPERVPRHSLPSRLFHWTMATSVFVLLFTSFLPIIGVKFAWVTPHWIAGLALTAAIVFHVVHATFWKGLRWMCITLDDCRQGWSTLRQALGRGAMALEKPGKNPLENKLFHHATSLATLATIATGLLMMVRVDTPFWTRNPYLLSDDSWGVMFAVHGGASIALIALIIVHIYFAVRPEKRWITWSMVIGWIPRRHYLRHYDPARWPIAESRDSREAQP